MSYYPTVKKDQPWRVNFRQPHPLYSDRMLSVAQGEDERWYIFHHYPDREGLDQLGGLAYTGGGFKHQADAVDEVLSYLKNFTGQVTVS